MSVVNTPCFLGHVLDGRGDVPTHVGGQVGEPNENKKFYIANYTNDFICFFVVSPAGRIKKICVSCCQEDRLTHVHSPASMSGKREMPKQSWKYHFAAALPRCPAKAALEAHQHLHGSPVLLAPRCASSVGRAVACWVIRGSILHPRFLLFPIRIEASHTIHQLREHTIHRGIEFGCVRVDIVASVMGINKGSQCSSLRGCFDIFECI